MKKFSIAILMVAAFFAVMPANAQLKFGLKGGLNVTNMSFNESVLDKSNRAGFFIGPTIKFAVPIVGIGVDASVLYDQREAKLNGENCKQKDINIPINLRYSVGLGDMASIYFAAGPQFGFNLGDKTFDLSSVNSAQTTAAQYKLKESNFSINVGAGVTLINHLEIGVAYNIVCGKTGDVTYTTATSALESVVKKNRTNAWQVSAAYYF